MDKPYILFAGDCYYPSGGWGDYRGRFASIEGAKSYLLEKTDWDWWHIVDEERGEIVEEGTNGLYR